MTTRPAPGIRPCMTAEDIEDAKRLLAGQSSFLEIPELTPVWQWAQNHRVLPSDVTAKPGPYDINVTPWMREPQEMIDDPMTSVIVLCLASRIGKTEMLLNLMGRTIHRDPRHVLLLYPTLDGCRKWSKEFFNPMIESSPCFKGLISDPKRRDGDNTLLSKRFPGGRISAIGANSPSGFRQIQAPIIIGDEIDAMENSREGDPITLAFKRADNYRDAVQIVASTPTVKGYSRIWDWLESSDFRKFFVPSPHTGKFQLIEWHNLRWPEGKPEKAVYVDPDTDQEWSEDQRRESVIAGRWEPTQEFTGIRGYWADAMLSLFPQKKGFQSKYHQWAAEFIEAKRQGKESLQVFTNTFRGLCFEEEYETTPWEEVAERREDYETDPIPANVLIPTFAADVQADRIEFEWVGWGDDFESWGLHYGVVSGDTKRPKVWQWLENEIRRKWIHPDYGDMGMVRGFIDEGYNAEMTRTFCKRMMQQGFQVYPCKGIGRAGLIDPELVVFNPNRKQKGIKCPTFNIGTNRAKKTIYSHALANPPGPHTMHFPNGYGYDDNYFQQLFAERVSTRQSYGQEYKVFVASPGTRNEALDIRVYNYAAAVSLNPRWSNLRDNLERKANAAKKTEPNEGIDEPHTKELTRVRRNGNASENPRRRRGVSSGGFVNNW